MSFFKTVIAKMRRKPSCSKLSEILLSCSNSEIRFCFRSDKNKNKYFDCCTTAKEATEICRILGNINLCCPEKDKNFIKYIPVMHKYGFALEFINRYGWLSEAYAGQLSNKALFKTQSRRFSLWNARICSITFTKPDINGVKPEKRKYTKNTR
mgnify:CR=1 FL=1